MGDSIRNVRGKGLVEGNSEWTEQWVGRAPARGCLGPNCLPTFQNIPQLSPYSCLGTCSQNTCSYQQQQLPDDGVDQKWPAGVKGTLPTRRPKLGPAAPLTEPVSTHHSVGFPTERRPVTIPIIPIALLRNNILKVMEIGEKAHLK